MLKSQKNQVIKNLTTELKSAQTIILVDFVGLNISAQEELKKRLSEIGAKMIVSKNTFIRLAGKEAKLDDKILTDSVLSGQTALIISSSDPVAPIQVIGKFAKEMEVPQFKVGIVEGNFQEKDNLIKLSKLPSREVLVGQVLSALASPMYGLVFSLNANMQKLVYLLNEKAKEVTN